MRLQVNPHERERPRYVVVERNLFTIDGEPFQIIEDEDGTQWAEDVDDG